MSDVGVRELKQRLSEYLERAGDGEIIRVTDRGRPKALLGPLPGRLRIEEGLAQGWLTAPSRKRLGSIERARAERSVGEVIGEDRGD